MKVLVINAGSSSLKYQLIDMDTETVLAKGNCERIGIDGVITHSTQQGMVLKQEVDFPSHTEAFAKLVSVLSSGEHAVVGDLSEIAAIGHRVAQGGNVFSKSVLLDDKQVAQIEDLSELAPLHNPAHVLAIKACNAVFSDQVPQVAVFDTSFHQTMPEKAFLYGIERKYYEQYHIRKYGFHGTSYRYVAARYGELTGKTHDTKLVVCHLGNGSSMAAIKDGKSIDTSMGFTPLDGLMMGTRSGSIDPSVLFYLMKKEHLTPDQMSDILNKRSGFVGASGVSSDSRDLVAAAKDGGKHAQVTIAMFRYQIKKLIGAYAAAMGGLDAVIFTGGIGENSFELREEVCSNMEFLGLVFDAEKNKRENRSETKISAENSRVEVYVIPTNEELLIARDTKEIVQQLG